MGAMEVPEHNVPIVSTTVSEVNDADHDTSHDPKAEPTGPPLDRDIAVQPPEIR
jgi:hypothetical protein